MKAPASGPILLGVDFSRDSEAAFLWAVSAASCFSVSLVVLHVVHDPESAPGSYMKRDESGHLFTMEETAREMLETFLEKMRTHPDAVRGIDISSRMASGLPANRILEIAEEEEAQLIVVGSQGRTGLEHLLLGSKAQRIAQLSPIPVTIVKRPREDR